MLGVWESGFEKYNVPYRFLISLIAATITWRLQMGNMTLLVDTAANTVGKKFFWRKATQYLHSTQTTAFKQEDFEYPLPQLYQVSASIQNAASFVLLHIASKVRTRNFLQNYKTKTDYKQNYLSEPSPDNFYSLKQVSLNL